MDDLNLNECEKEQLHLSGKIQSFGALIAIRKSDQIISHVSENIHRFLGKSLGELLEQPLLSLSSVLVELVSELEFNETQKYINRIFNEFENRLYLRFSEDESHIIVDIEIYQHPDTEVLLQSDQVKEINFSPDTQTELKRYYQNFVNLIKTLIGFDRVMIYQFQPDWSGIVVAEAADSQLGSYLDLRWPASDIPNIARTLYKKNPSRIICNAEDTQVKIVSKSNEPIDLTYSETRSVSPVHLEYLKNMGVKASFSIPIMQNGQLWGLVACHHIEPKKLDAHTKKKAIEFTQKLSRGIQFQAAKSKVKHYDDREVVIQKIINTLSKGSSLKEKFEPAKEALLRYIDSNGFALITNEGCFMHGDTPSETELKHLENYLKQHSSNTLKTQILAELNTFVPGYSGPPGIVGAHSNKSEGKDILCFWFKEEVIQEVTWAGNPNKPVSENTNAKRLSPRNSFEKWVQIEKGHSRPFGRFDEGSALHFCNSIIDYL